MRSPWACPTLLSPSEEAAHSRSSKPPRELGQHVPASWAPCSNSKRLHMPGRGGGRQAAPEPWREMKSTPDSRAAAGGRLAPRSPAGPTIISYDMVYLMLLVSFLAITFY